MTAPGADPASGHRLFPDANVLFSAAYRPGSALAALWRLGSGVQLLSCPYAAAEARRNLDAADARGRLEALLASVTLAPDVLAGAIPDGVTLPDKDLPILLTAAAVEATHLLTGDRAHFGPYFGRVVAGVRVERPGDYLRRAAERRS